MGGRRGGNRDEGVNWTCLLLPVGERKFSPEFTATKLLKILYNIVRRVSTLLCSKVLQLSSVSISAKLANSWYLPSAHLHDGPSLHHFYIVGTIVFHTFTRAPNSTTVFKRGA